MAFFESDIEKLLPMIDPRENVARALIFTEYGGIDSQNEFTQPPLIEEDSFGFSILSGEDMVVSGSGFTWTNPLSSVLKLDFYYEPISSLYSGEYQTLIIDSSNAEYDLPYDIDFYNPDDGELINLQFTISRDSSTGVVSVSDLYCKNYSSGYNAGIEYMWSIFSSPTSAVKALSPIAFSDYGYILSYFTLNSVFKNHGTDYPTRFDVNIRCENYGLGINYEVLILKIEVSDNTAIAYDKKYRVADYTWENGVLDRKYTRVTLDLYGRPSDDWKSYILIVIAKSDAPSLATFTCNLQYPSN